MAKKEKVVLENIELKPQVIGKTYRKKSNLGRVIVIFIIFILVVYANKFDGNIIYISCFSLEYTCIQLHHSLFYFFFPPYFFRSYFYLLHFHPANFMTKKLMNMWLKMGH